MHESLGQNEIHQHLTRAGNFRCVFVELSTKFECQILDKRRNFFFCGGQFISGGVHISFMREADIERLQLFGKNFGRALRGLKRGNNLILPIKPVG